MRYEYADTIGAAKLMVTMYQQFGYRAYYLATGRTGADAYEIRYWC